MLDFESVIAKYIDMRKQCEDIEHEAKVRVKEIKTQMALLEAWVTTHADEEGLKTVPTHAGTAYWSTHHTCSVAAPSVFFDFVRSHEAWDLLEKRASKSSVLAYINEEGGPPPGVNFSSYRVFNVRESRPE